MVESLYSLMEKTFAAGSQLEYWQPILQDLEGQVLQFEVIDGDSLYVEFHNGQPQLKKGVSNDKKAEVVRASEQVWRDVFECRRRLVDAAWEGDLNARIYHGRGDLYFMIASFSRATQGVSELF